MTCSMGRDGELSGALVGPSGGGGELHVAQSVRAIAEWGTMLKRGTS
jgi:hypothetical protein